MQLSVKGSEGAKKKTRWDFQVECPGEGEGLLPDCPPVKSPPARGKRGKREMNARISASIILSGQKEDYSKARVISN